MPGEKLYEEMLMKEEGMKETANRQIFIGRPIELDEIAFFRQLNELKIAAENESDDIRSYVKEIVPTYKPPEEQTAEQNAAKAAAEQQNADGPEA